MRVGISFLFLGLTILAAGAVETLPVSALKPGMKGITYTVMEGSQIVPLETEVLGVSKNELGPGMDLIVCKLIDPKTAVTGAVHGMSGSPLYIDGKLVGALSRGLAEFQKDGQCGYTPIADMLEVRDNAAKTGRRTLSASRLPKSVGPAAPPTPAVAARSSQARLENFITPITINGLDPQRWQQLARGLGIDDSRFFAVPGGGQTTDSLGPETLQPGAAVAAVLMTGSVSIAGTGTLTWRDGNQILAFGHPMLGEGESELPMATAEIISTIPSYVMPFKMANTSRIVGTISQDRYAAISGTIGPVPKLASYRVERTFNGKSRPLISGEFAPHPLLSPLLVGAALEAALMNHNDISREFTMRVRGELKVAGHPPLVMDGVYAGEDMDLFAAGMQMLRPVATLYNQGFELIRAESLSLQIEMEETPHRWTIDSVRADRTQCKPGDTVDLTVEMRALYGERKREQISVKLPDNVKSGTLRLRVAGAGAIDRPAQVRGLEAAQNVDEMIAVLNRRRQLDRLYVQVLTRAPGVVVADREMPSLPPTVRALMEGGNRSPDVTSLDEQIWLETNKPLPGMVTGQQEVEVELK